MFCKLKFVYVVKNGQIFYKTESMNSGLNKFWEFESLGIKNMKATF